MQPCDLVVSAQVGLCFVRLGRCLFSVQLVLVLVKLVSICGDVVCNG